MRQVSMSGINRNTPGYIGNVIGIISPSSPVLIVIIETSGPYCLNVSQEVGNKLQSTSPGLVRQSQKLDASVDGKLSDDWDLTFIFSKVIGENISNSSIRDLYMR